MLNVTNSQQLTRLFFGLPAVLKDNYWIVFSSDLTNLARIPEDRIDSSEVFDELVRNGFMVTKETAEENKVVSVTLILTNDCNLRCKYCFAGSGVDDKDNEKIMSEEIAFASVRYGAGIAKGRKLSVSFFGGEPTMQFKLIKKVVDFTRKLSEDSHLPVPEFSITTNGVFGKEVSEYLIENSFLITLSADGPADIQNFNRPTVNGESSRIVEKTIERFAAKNYAVKVRVTVTEMSVHKMADIVFWLASFKGISPEIHFEPVSISGRARSSCKEVGKPSAENFVLNLKKAIEAGAISGVNVVNSSFMNLVNTPFKFCEGNAHNRFAITPVGSVTKCVEVQDACHPASSLFIIGEYDKLTSRFVFSEKSDGGACGDSQPVIDFRSNKGLNCSSCFASRICGGGCPVRNFHTVGKTSTVDPYRCMVIQEMVPYVYKMIDASSD